MWPLAMGPWEIGLHVSNWAMANVAMGKTPIGRDFTVDWYAYNGAITISAHGNKSMGDVSLGKCATDNVDRTTANTFMCIGAASGGSAVDKSIGNGATANTAADGASL